MSFITVNPGLRFLAYLQSYIMTAVVFASTMMPSTFKPVIQSIVSQTRSERGQNGEGGGSVVEHRTPEQEVRGSKLTSTVLCP